MPNNLTIRPAKTTDLDGIIRLHKAAFGPGRFARTAYRVREGTAPVSPDCRVAELDGRLVAALRMTQITIGGKNGALLLGPVAVEPRVKGLGYGKALIARAVEDAKANGFRLVVLVGDLPYYGRFGFAPIPPGAIMLPGPVNPQRILGLSLVPGAVDEFHGLIETASG